MNLRLLCSTCSNPQSPEFRDFTWGSGVLTCPICGRTLKIIKPEQYKGDDFIGRILKRNRIDKEDYVLETIATGEA